MRLRSLPVPVRGVVEHIVKRADQSAITYVETLTRTLCLCCWCCACLTLELYRGCVQARAQNVVPFA
ncbi:hypothetical protein NDU88_010709 [Pleurodeles waltl]|uniref:Secreted protein n=1 Tax=Pleurodeles waltl TaxID=8319 RepID=A0AAV7R1C2_PLEWA|nr:hypothetical protein NDU88_010709 [Pleurodeles waltl]